MKFKLVKPGCENSRAYGHDGLKTGDVIELNDHFSRKAMANPDFEEYTPPKKVVKKAAKKSVKKKK